MGSLAASGIPVVSKESRTYRKRDNFITVTDSRDDDVSTLVDFKPDQHRAIGSGSIVRDDGVADQYEERVWGLQKEARSSDARIARDGARNLSVARPEGSGTLAVIPPALEPTTPQIGAVHTGERVVRRDSTTDDLIDRVPSSGAFD